MYLCTFYLDDLDAVDLFIKEAVPQFLLPGKDSGRLSWLIRCLMRGALDQYCTYHGQILFEPLTQANEYEVKWLWPGHIASGKLTMLVGDHGVGKGLVSLDVAAHVSTGQPWPQESLASELCEPGRVLLFAEWDDIDDTIRPRLEAMGADLDQFVLIRSIVPSAIKERCLEAESMPFSVSGQLTMLRDCLERFSDCKLVIIDPISSYIESNYSRGALNEILQELADIAVTAGVAILAVSHAARGSQSLFHYGSQANARLAAAARSVWRIVGHPSDRKRRLLLPVKNNLGRDWLGMSFVIEISEDNAAPKIVWQPSRLEIAVDRTAVDPEVPNVLPNNYAVHRKMIHEWLTHQQKEGERFAQDVLAAANVAKIGEKSLRRALRETSGSTAKGLTEAWVWQPADNTPKNTCQVDQVDRLESKHAY